MKSHKYRTIAGILILIVITPACKKTEDKPDETHPVLSVTPVDISSVTSIIAFGADLTSQQKNPAFEYIVNNSAVITKNFHTVHSILGQTHLFSSINPLQKHGVLLTP